MDESGLIQLEKVESLFEKTVNEEEAPKADDPSTLEQIKNAFNNIWPGEKKEESAEEAKTEETKEEERKEGDAEGGKKEEKPEEKTETKEEPEGEKATDKTEEPEQKEGEKEEKKDEKKEEAAKEEAAKEEKKSVPKQVTVKEPIESSTVFADMVPASAESLKAARAALKKLDDADEERIKREAAQNALETFIYDTKDKLNNDEFGSCATGKNQT